MDASADRGERRERRRPQRPVENLTQSLLPLSADCWSCSANSFFLRFGFFFVFKSRLKSVQSAPVFWNRRDVSSGIFSLITLKQSLAGKCQNKPGSCCCVFCTVLLFYVGCVDAAAVFCDVLHVSPCFFSLFSLLSVLVEEIFI